MASKHHSRDTEREGRNPGEKLYQWDDTANWPNATYTIGVVVYEDLVIVRPPHPIESRWKWGLDPDVALAYGKLYQRAIERIREDAAELDELVDQQTVREVCQRTLDSAGDGGGRSGE